MHLLVIFDCDGVLVDTERITNRLLAEMATELGIPMTWQDSVERFKGRDLQLIQVEIEEALGRPLGDGWITEYRERMFAEFEKGVPEIAGARAMIESVMPACCVASNAPRKKMEASLGSTGLIDLFAGKLFSAYEVGKWKPEPDLFLHAAAEMGFAVGDCVVVEDSTSGVEAAVRAGMRVLAFADLTSRDSLLGAGANEVHEDLDGIRNALAELADSQ